jgi:hypothetical protein
MFAGVGVLIRMVEIARVQVQQTSVSGWNVACLFKWFTDDNEKSELDDAIEP